MKPVVIMLVYVDDCIIILDSMMKIDYLIHTLQNGSENFVLTVKDTIDKFLGVNIEKIDDKKYEFSQPFLIERLINFLKKDFDTEPKVKDRITPAGKPLLHAKSYGLLRKHTWNYRTAVGMAGYLQGNTRPDISMAVHQCARFVNNPMRSHERAMYQIEKYLISTKEREIIYSPDPSLGLECFVDADFAGGW